MGAASPAAAPELNMNAFLSGGSASAPGKKAENKSSKTNDRAHLPPSCDANEQSPLAFLRSCYVF